jgi:hypothetical protein
MCVHYTTTLAVGFGSKTNLLARTIPTMIADAVRNAGDKPALRVEAGLPAFDKANVPPSAVITLITLITL